MQIFKRALLWSVAGTLAAVVIWSALGAIFWEWSINRVPIRDVLANFLAGFVGSAIFALVVGAICAPAYVIVFALWQLSRDRMPAWRNTTLNRALICLALALPPVIALVWGFGHTNNLPFNWSRTAVIAPLALVSCWAGVWLPPRIFAQLKSVLVAPHAA